MEYLERIREVLARLAGQEAAVGAAADLAAEAIARGRLVHVFGSGHSVIPALDIFPRYGSFVGFFPLVDPRLMWFEVVGPGGAPQLLWLERQEGYVRRFLEGRPLAAGDVLVVFSHGGLNAAPVEAALYARERGLSVVAVTSGDNLKVSRPTHSSGQRLGDLAQVVIDNGVPPEDALVKVPGLAQPLAAGSTVAASVVVGLLVSETGRRLVARGILPEVFVSPNVAGVSPDHNPSIFARHLAYLRRAQGGP